MRKYMLEDIGRRGLSDEGKEDLLPISEKALENNNAHQRDAQHRQYEVLVPGVHQGRHQRQCLCQALFLEDYGIED
jgi:hypothetical protein